MKSVVITGADGFIGHHLARHMSAQGIHVYAVVMEGSPTVGRLSGISNVSIVVGNLNDYQKLAQHLPDQPVALIHLAWAGVSPTERDCMDTQYGNIALCMNAVRLAAMIQAERFVLPGSTGEYAYCNQPINNNSLPSPINAYGASCQPLSMQSSL